MNTAKLKKYAPQARREFITAVSKQLNQLGIYSDKQISEVKQEGSVLLIEGKTFEPSVKTARERLVKKVQAMGYNQLVEQVAYTWFNRLCAIRYMEIHDYLGHGFRVLSHSDNPKGFEIIDHAQDAADELGLDRARIIELKLAGNKDEELYRELLLGQCHKLHEAMPFLFDALDDETELLLPDNLTRTDSILRGLVDSIPEEDWQQVEVIGWLYQFYISEKKDQVMGKVVKSEDIPAATQLFTPNWIVKYLVQNSVGRQWLGTYPKSDLLERLKEIDKKKKQKIALLRGESNVDDIKGEVFYIHPAEQIESVKQHLHSIVPESIEPETIKVLDPACGSGHILIEAYNVLKAIYEERGFRSRDIPKMILENNLCGLDIDDRAAQLSGFALMMMARDDDKRIFTRNVRLNVLSLQESNHIDLPTLWKALNLSGSWQSGTSQGLFSDDEQDLSSFNADNRYQLLKRTLARFTQAKTFGSLIDVPSDEHDQLKELLSTLVELQESGDSMQKPAAKQLIDFVHQAFVLSIRYDAVIANPPYMGGKGMNADLKDFAKKQYPNSKSDLFAIFMERAFALISKYGFNAQINMQSWMFLSSYEKLRNILLEERTLITMAHLGSRAFSQISGEVVQTTAWIFHNKHVNQFKPVFNRLIDGSENDKKIRLLNNEYRYSRIMQNEFQDVPGSPIAYWVSRETIDSFALKPFGEHASLREGIHTGYNDGFVRHWAEVNFSSISFESGNQESFDKSGKRYAPYNKGGSFRKWYGNNENVIAWDQINRSKMSEYKGHVRPSQHLYFLPSVEWSLISSGRFGARLSSQGSLNDVASHYLCSESESVINSALAIFNSKLGQYFLSLLNPTLNFSSGVVARIPFAKVDNSNVIENIESAVDIVKNDWDMFENSFDFKFDYWIDGNNKISETIKRIVDIQSSNLDSLREYEYCVNDYLIKEFGLEEDLDPNIKYSELTLTSNPYLVDEDLGVREANQFRTSLLMQQLISFCIGVSMGRFSLDQHGLVYAGSGNDGFDVLVSAGAYKTFSADEDGIIPLTDQEWFKDDATNRFREFVQVVWGEEHLQENLDFVAESLCLNAIKPKKSESALETIRRYLSTQFYKDHLKTYKKRPIYWLFSSGKQKAFECLVYLHRYNEGTLSRMRTEYVTPLLGKYDAYAEQLEKQIETADSTVEANRFKKELDALIKKQVELREFDDKLKHYADMRISLDLDDGVKVNYGKFGDLLADVKAITGSAPEVN